MKSKEELEKLTGELDNWTVENELTLAEATMILETVKIGKHMQVWDDSKEA